MREGAALTEQEVAYGALSTLRRFPYLAARVPEERLTRSLAATWPDPAAPLIYWLYVAQTDLVGHAAAEACIQSLELLLALLQNSTVVRGAWPSRVAKLIPPPRRATFDDFVEFRSALFELIAAYRLITNDSETVIESDSGPHGCDLTVVFGGAPLLGIEAYAPQKGVREWYDDTVARPWRQLVEALGEQEIGNAGSGLRDITIDPDAASTALMRVLTDSNFQEQKAKQLAAGELPTLLMIRGYHLTRRLEELITTPTAQAAMELFGDDVWSRLPGRCRGILLAFLGDILHDVIRRQSPVLFIPVPGRALPDDAWAYLARAGMISRGIAEQRERGEL